MVEMENSSESVFSLTNAPVHCPCQEIKLNKKQSKWKYIQHLNKELKVSILIQNKPNFLFVWLFIDFGFTLNIILIFMIDIFPHFK